MVKVISTVIHLETWILKKSLCNVTGIVMEDCAKIGKHNIPISDQMRRSGEGLRNDVQLSDVNFPFIRKHRQFPRFPEHAVNINTSQRHKYEPVGISLNEPVYFAISNYNVAASQTSNPANIKLIKP